MKKNWLPRAATLLICVFHALTSTAQNPQYRLQETYLQALEQYPALHAQRERIRARELEQKETSSLQLPETQLQMQNSYGTFYGSTGSVFPLPGVFNVNPGEQNREGGNTLMTTYGSIVADWTVFAFGKTRAQKAAATHRVEEAHHQLGAAKLSLMGKVADLYLHNLYTRWKYEIAVKNATRLRMIHEISKSYADAGLTPGADTSLSLASYLKYRADAAQWKGKMNASQKEMEAFTGQVFGTANKSRDAFLGQRPTLSVVEEVDQHHPYLLGFESRKNTLHAEQRVAKGESLPCLSVLGGISVRGSSLDQGNGGQDWGLAFQDPQQNYLVGLGLKWNLTGSYRSKLQQKKLRHEQSAVSSDFDEAKKHLAASLSSLRLRLQQDLATADELEVGVEKVQEAFALYQTRYESGLLGLTELLQIQSALQEAENELVEAYHTMWANSRRYAELTNDFSQLFTIF